MSVLPDLFWPPSLNLNVGDFQESKRARKTVSQFQSPIPDMQQIMKKIQDKEAGDKEKKAKDTNPTVFFK